MDISLFELVDIIEIEEYHKCNMIDIEVEEDHTFILSNGLISHNSAAGNGIKVRDPKKHGFFPLRGMPMNTFGAKHKDILDNKELSNIMAILGLKFGMSAGEISMGIEYGRIGILADADVDGWPSGQPI